MDISHVDSSTYSVGDTVTYRNYLREFEGKECTGEVIDIIETQKTSNGEFYIIKDNDQIRSVHVSSIISYH